MVEERWVLRWELEMRWGNLKITSFVSLIQMNDQWVFSFNNVNYSDDDAIPSYHNHRRPLWSYDLCSFYHLCRSIFRILPWWLCRLSPFRHPQIESYKVVPKRSWESLKMQRIWLNTFWFFLVLVLVVMIFKCFQCTET